MNSRWLVAAALAICAQTLAAPNMLSPTDAESQPLTRKASTTRSGSAIWDQGAPNLANGFEITQWRNAENFSLSETTRLTSCTFWTLESGATWDGTCVWEIRTSNEGSPGSLIYSSTTGLSRTPTGRAAFGLNEFENSFSFPSFLTLDAGEYFLVLRMSADCLTREQIFWETSAGGAAPGYYYDLECANGWTSAGIELAFTLNGKPLCADPPTPFNPFPISGSTNLPFNGITLFWNNLCTVANLNNPGFESGDFSGWDVNTTIPPGGLELSPFTVASGGGWFSNAVPFEGSFFAGNGFDGSAGLTYELWQDIFIPPSLNAVLTWRDRIQYDSLGNSSTQPRTLTVTVQPAGGGAPLATIHEFSFNLNGASYTDTGYITHSVDLASLGLTGIPIRIHWRQYIPENLTGPAQYEIDGIELSCEAPSNPPFGKETTAAQRSASDAAFAAKVAMYNAVRRGEHRSFAEAQVSGKFTPAAGESALNIEPTDEYTPPSTLPLRGISNLLFDGAPPILGGNEVANWRQTEDFDVAADSNIYYVRFWTLEVPGQWDGNCEITFHADNTGSPNPAPYFTANGILLSRSATGNSSFGADEYEYLFAIPGGASVPQGRNWLGLHMSADCTSFDNVFWSWAANPFGNLGHEFFQCGGAPSNNGRDHAFQLYGDDAECPVTYNVYLRRIPDGQYILACSDTPNPQCFVESLVCGSEYEWIVEAFTSDGYAYSNSWTFTTAPCCCPGDANGDRVVNFTDITIVLFYFNSSCP